MLNTGYTEFVGTLEETKKTTDLDQFDRLVYKVSKKGG